MNVHIVKVLCSFVYTPFVSFQVDLSRGTFTYDTSNQFNDGEDEEEEEAEEATPDAVEGDVDLISTE